MNLKNIIPLRFRSRLVRQFGDATLIRRPNSQLELVGGTDTDRVNAFEWVSLFAHEIAFTHFHREDYARRRNRISKRASRPRIPRHFWSRALMALVVLKQKTSKIPVNG